MKADDPRHGTRFGYRDDRCKCNLCKKAVALNHNLYKLRRAANGGRPLLISKVGAVRRLQALMTLGWPRRVLAEEAGYKGDVFSLVLNGRRQTLTLATHQRIADLYERLCMTPGPSSSTRIRAAKKGWAPPLAWNDIDDPCERPMGQVRGHGNREDLLDEAVVHRVLNGQPRPRKLTRAQ